MASALPQEIWTLIIGHLPRRSLRNVRSVNRTFSAIVSFKLQHILDLHFSDEQSLERLECLNKQISAAKNRPTNIREFRVFTSIRLQLPSSRFLHRHRKHNIRVATNWEAEFFQANLSVLVPRLTKLKKLSIIDPTLWGEPHENWLPYCCEALKINSPHLTILCLHLQSLRVFDYEESSSCPPFPQLRIFRLHLLDPYNFERCVFRLLSCSLVLEEVDYKIVVGRSMSERTDMTNCKSVHPRLRCFKWTTIAGYGSPGRFTLHSRPFSPLMNSAASQLTCVHFNPLPHGIDLSSFDVTGLTELRINFSDPTFEETQAFHRLLEGVERLETIEVIGLKVPPLELRGVHTHLRKLYLEFKTLEFLQALTVLPTKAPKLETLVLVVDGWCRAKDLRRDIKHIVSQIDASNLTSSSKWGVWDLGIIMTRTSLAWSVETFPGVMKAISRKFPNIRSFYGTGQLLLYKGLEKNIDDDWAGEFCGSPVKI